MDVSVGSSSFGRCRRTRWRKAEACDQDRPQCGAFWAELQHISLDGASGLEAFRCDETTDWCYGWLKVSRGRVIWVVSATGNGARLPSIKAFVRSFQPAHSSHG